VSTEVEDLLSKCVELREAGRLDEAIIAARRATGVDSDSANAAWQLGLCVAKKNGDSAALEYFEKTVELAEDFAYGWWRLGAAYQALDRLDDAISAWERSVELDEDSERTRQSLIDVYIKKGVADFKEEALTHLLALENQGELRTYDRYVLGWIKHTKKDYFGALRNYKDYLSYEDSAGAYANLGLVYATSEINQRLDAIDCCRMALNIDADFNTAKKLLDKVEPKLARTRSAVLKYLEKNDIQRRENNYQHYISPIELLQLDESVDPSLDVKDIQKAKKLLLQEIELEEGRVSWIQDLYIDKSRAIRIADEMLDVEIGDFHKTVYFSPPLLRFLSTGCMDLFLYDSNNIPTEIIKRLEYDEDFAKWLSQIFRAQYDAILPSVLQSGNLNLIEALLDGRRFVTNEDEELCFVSSMRAASEMLQPIRDLADSVSESKPSTERVTQILSDSNLIGILGLLPSQFKEIHTEAGQLIRGISVDLYNLYSDADFSKAVLRYAESFVNKSPSLMIRYEKDVAKIDELINEEKKDECYLTFGDKPFRITRSGITHNGQTINSVDVETVRWGITVTNDSGSKKYEFKIVVGGSGSSKIEVLWRSGTDIKKQEELFQKCVDAIFSYIFPTVHKKISAKLDAGKVVYIGGIPLTKGGVTLVASGWFTNTEEHCAWDRLNAEVRNGDVVLTSRSNPKATASLSLSSIDNAWVLLIMARNGAK